MKKGERLRGRGVFTSLYESGRSLQGELLRCFVRIDTGAGTPIRAGFSVSSRSFNAVRRNRVRRILRAAFDAERANLTRAAVNAERRISMLVVYRGRSGLPVERLQLADVRSDMAAFSRKICGMLLPASS